MRFLLLTFLLLINLTFINAREVQTVQKYEAEVWCGVALPIGGYHGGEGSGVGALGLNVRYNIKGTPWDAGAFLRLDVAQYEFGRLRQGNRTLGVGLSGGYNLRQGKRVNPFVNLGLGVGIHDIVSDEVYPAHGSTMVVIPTVGVELFYHIRVNAYSEISRQGYNMVGISLGLVIGGRPKR